MKPAFIASVLLISTHCRADVTLFYSKPQWQGAVGSWETIDFTGWPQGTNITTQYQGMGVVFDPTYTYNYIHYNATLFPNDGWGLTGGVTLGSAHLHMDFSTPQYWIAIEHTGIVFFELYSSDQLIYTSPDHQGSAYTTPQPFFGLFSTAPFDTVVVVRPDANNVNIDNLYWGPGIPAPGALGLVGVAALTLRKRRRS